jgi:putative redox protein
MALSLIWDKDLNFHADGGPALNLASSSPDAYSPMQILAHAIMGCMAMDVVHILKKGRHDLQALSVEFDGVRAEGHPRRYVKVHLTFHLKGNVAADVVERAIALSKSTYCSVSNTLRSDLEFTTSVTISA